MKVIISGGGTGGHIFPAIAIAKCLQRRHKDCEILFVGAEGKMEMQKVPQAGFQIVGLRIAGFHRKKLWKNIFLPFKMLSSYLRAKRIIKNFAPNIVIGVGGYASWAILKSAQRLGIPTLLQEQNSFAGKSNQILARKAYKICVAYDNTDRFFAKSKIVKTGNPVRKDIKDIIKNRDVLTKKGRDFYSFDGNKPTVLIIGGSLGAKSINQAVENNIDWFINSEIQLIWQTGKFYYNDIKTRIGTKIEQHNNIKPMEFIQDMDVAYSVADIIVSRAGALAISELCIVGKPVILVPSPNVAEDHQKKNAMALVEKEAAIMIPDNELNDKIIDNLSELIKNKDLQNSLAKNILTLAQTDADEKIVDEIEKIMLQK